MFNSSPHNFIWIQSSETTELVTTKDAVERFRKFGFRLMTYAILGNGDFVYQFDATISTTRYNLFIRILVIEITWLYSSKAGRKIEFHTKNALYKKINWILFLCLLNRCDPYEQVDYI